MKQFLIAIALFLLSEGMLAQTPSIQITSICQHDSVDDLPDCHAIALNGTGTLDELRRWTFINWAVTNIQDLASPTMGFQFLKDGAPLGILINMGLSLGVETCTVCYYVPTGAPDDNVSYYAPAGPGYGVRVTLYDRGVLVSSSTVAFTLQGPLPPPCSIGLPVPVYDVFPTSDAYSQSILIEDKGSRIGLPSPWGCRSAWRVTSNAPWLTVSPATGTYGTASTGGPGLATVSWSQNLSATPRYGTVIIADSTTGTGGVGVGVYQAGAPSPTPAPTPTPTATRTPTPTPTLTASRTPTPTQTPTTRREPREGPLDRS